MGSGKTTLLKSLINELAQQLGVQRVLIITYRQSLSLNMLAELGELGFINYLPDILFHNQGGRPGVGHGCLSGC